MWFILKTSIDYRCKNLLISNKVAVIILDEYSDASFHNIILVERHAPNEQL